MAEVSEETWKSSMARVRNKNEELARALDSYRSAHIQRLGRAPSCTIDSYSFGQLIFDAGRPLRSSSSKPFEPGLLYGKDPAFPLGLIIEGKAEVAEFVYGAGALRGVPQSLLQEGDFIGSFEYLDYKFGSKPKPVPDWTLTAGTPSIRCAFATKSDAFSRHLAKKLGKQKINGQAIKSGRSFVEQLTKVEPIRKFFDNCKTKVMYFGHDWLQPSSKDHASDALTASRTKLDLILYNQSWRSSSRIRPSSDEVAKYFYPDDRKFSQPEYNERDLAIHTFKSLHDLLTGRRPLFVAERDSEPFREICEYLKGYNDDQNPFVMRPCYLEDSTSRSGFMPVNGIASALIEGNRAHHDALLNTFNAIDQAATDSLRQGGLSALHEFGRIIETISVRCPPAKTDSATGRTWKLSWDPGRGVQSNSIPDGEFFRRTGVELSRPNADFFKTCIRFNLID